jgi:hypothetical protein
LQTERDDLKNNDPVVAVADRCVDESTSEPFSGTSIMLGTDGSPTSGCEKQGGARRWYGPDGEEILATGDEALATCSDGYELKHMGYQDRALIWPANDELTCPLRIVDLKTLEYLTVSGPEHGCTVLGVRAREDGFRVACTSGESNADLYKVTWNRTAVKERSYVITRKPWDIPASMPNTALHSDGDLYGIANRDESDESTLDKTYSLIIRFEEDSDPQIISDLDDYRQVVGAVSLFTGP